MSALNINLLFYKMLIYGYAGTGKSQLAMSVPATGKGKNVLYLAIENNGIRFHDIPKNYHVVDDIKSSAQFDAWMNSFAKSKAFDTIVIDSLTYLVEFIMREKKNKLNNGTFITNQKLGMQIQDWGWLVDTVLGFCFNSENLKNKNVIILGHASSDKNGKIEISVPTDKAKGVYKYFDTVVYTFIENGVFKTTTIGEDKMLDAKNRVGTPQVLEDSTLEKILTKNKE